MIKQSLRLRLLVGGTLAIAVALAIAWVVMTMLFARQGEQRLQDDLVVQAAPLVAGLVIDRAGKPMLDDEPLDPRFSVPGSGRYWQIAGPGGTLRSRSLWDARLPAGMASTSEWSGRSVVGPFDQRLLVVTRAVRVSDRPLVVQVAADLADLAPAQHAFAREIGVFLLILLTVLATAAWVQVSLGLRPILEVEGGVRRLRTDPTARLGDKFTIELRPLTDAIDALADARAADVARARRRAADLAHGLKTPLAALAVQSERARVAGAEAAADGLDAAIAAVRAAVDGELARTRIGLAQADTSHTLAAPLIHALIDVLEHTDAGERVVITAQAEEWVMLPLAGDDAAELIGPLLENAVRHARRQVSITVTVSPDGATTLTVADDGPGIADAQRAEAILRGARIDSVSDGYGLGLAIARELAEATGGEMRLEAAGLGGLEVSVRWRSALPT